ncbi:ThuA domain-containing protein [Thalassotalea fonticola]|uniref:ThuA domain-containing protein n=1 Tax=Thalassotalea fonticola TaxID=3065649 RepID=A0ABZ0GU65_9GAMM|nr:ThuA domain-containing protein [Colwelliaceae bacterium S1-1]
MKLLITLCRVLIAIVLISASSHNAAADSVQGSSTALVKQAKTPKIRVLVFAKTASFRHKSIAAGKLAIKKLGLSHGFEVEISENAAQFTYEALQQFNVVVFLNTTGDILTPKQQSAFERYIQAGGGFVGIHAATDTEYDWSWYGKLVGAYFASHPKQQIATILVDDNSHQSTVHLNSQWQRFDEWYNFRSLNPEVKVLLSLDESSYQGGKNGQHHPIAWYHEYDGGRAFYTGGGHTTSSYAEPQFLQHLLGGILYSASAQLTDK